MSVFEKLVLPLFGVFGTLITILTFIFPQYANMQVKLSIYVSTILLLLLICSIFIKMWFNIRRDIKDSVYFNNFSLKPIQFVRDDNILILKRTINLPLNTAVSIYHQNDSYESIVTIGYVSHVQEKIIQIKILFPNTNISMQFCDNNILKQIIVRPASNVNNILEKLSEGAK
ncbi:MAG: hypothetical protein FWD82_06955 [Defluviitaleaceae bacterium]|nr:hypothetical protein [Defluviitaleaceae bacterium]